MTDDFNMSMRKYLKQVGLTSRKAIEDALRYASDTQGRGFQARIVSTLDGSEMEHVLTGTIKGHS